MFKSCRNILAVGLLVALGLTCSVATQAASTTIYPAGHTFTISSQSVRLDTGFYGIDCIWSGGTLSIPRAPANNNPSGAVTMNFTTNPTFTSCTNGGIPTTVTTSGTWTFRVQAGFPHQSSISIPARGLAVTVSPGCTSKNSNATAFPAATWQNGFASPAFVNSETAFNGAFLSMPVDTPCLLSIIVPVGTARSVVDTTSRTDVILVGP